MTRKIGRMDRFTAAARLQGEGETGHPVERLARAMQELVQGREQLPSCNMITRTNRLPERQATCTGMA